MSITGWGTKINNNLDSLDTILGTPNIAEDSDNHDGLDFYYKAGQVYNGTTVNTVSASHVTLDDDDTSYIEVTLGGVVSANTTGFTTGRIPLFTVVTVAGEINTVTDKRSLLGTINSYLTDIDQALGTTDNVEFNNLGLGGSLTLDNNNDDKIILEAASLAVNEDNWIRFKADGNELFRLGTDGNTTVNTTLFSLLDASGTELLHVTQAGVLNIAGLTASKVLQTDASKNLESSTVTATELGLLSGLTGTIWTSNNDGAASGLDSDLLDAQEGSYYLDWGNFTNIPSEVSGMDQDVDTTATPSFASLDAGSSCEADAYTVGGVAGANFNGAITNITVVDGIVTAAS